MAHFAQINEDGYVVRVVVVSNDDLLDADGQESEELGQQFCQQLFGEGGWVQTSYHGNIRGKFAGIGDYYDEELDEFV